MNEINLVVSNKLRPWQYVAKDIIAAIGGVESSLNGDLSDLEGRVSAVEGRATDLEAAMTAVEGRATALEGRATTVEGKVSTLEGKVSANEAAISTLEGAVSGSEGDISDLQGRMTTVEGKVSTNEGKISTLEGKVSTNEGAISTLEGKVSANESAIAALQTTYAATDTYGITKITDSTSTTEIEAGMAASPKAVYDALQLAYSYADAQLAQGIAGAYKYKGSVTDVSALPASDAEGLAIGDIYNVQGTTDGENDGVNYAWTGTSWDNLGGIFKVETAISDGNASSMNPVATSAVKTYVDTAVSSINSDISGVATRVTALEGRMTTAEGAISTLEGKVSTNESKISTLEGKVSTNEGKISTLEGKVSTNEGAISTLEGKVSTLETQMNDSSTGVLARLTNLETGAPTSVTAESKASGSSVTVTKDSDTVAIYNTTGAFTLAFTAAGASDYAVKEILLHATGDTTLTVTGAVFADAEEDPDWGKTGYELYLRATFINGGVILQVLSNGQEAYNAQQYTPA